MSNEFLISHSRQPPLTVGEHLRWETQTPVAEKKNATTSEPMSDPEFRLAIERLKMKLSSKQSLRHDVPRGYYLNLRV
ncbi:hypothetical protein OAJ77_02220 [Rhodospirillales bacterium]|nr:hypothetical protein [Rhodospirillales bacterium]